MRGTGSPSRCLKVIARHPLRRQRIQPRVRRCYAEDLSTHSNSFIAGAMQVESEGSGVLMERGTHSHLQQMLPQPVGWWRGSHLHSSFLFCYHKSANPQTMCSGSRPFACAPLLGASPKACGHVQSFSTMGWHAVHKLTPFHCRWSK